MPLTAARVAMSERTPELENIFFDALAKTGNVFAACRASGLNRTAVYQQKDKDPTFATRWNDALQANIADFEMELKRRAVDGIQDPVFYRDKIVGYRRKCSDNLMMFSLSALHPEKYRQKYEVAGSIQHNHKAELPEAVLSILDSLKAVNVTPEAERIEHVTDNPANFGAINSEVWRDSGAIQGDKAGGNDGQIDPAGLHDPHPAGWTVRKVEGRGGSGMAAGQDGSKAAVKVRRYGVK